MPDLETDQGGGEEADPEHHADGGLNLGREGRVEAGEPEDGKADEPQDGRQG